MSKLQIRKAMVVCLAMILTVMFICKADEGFTQTTEKKKEGNNLFEIKSLKKVKL